MGVIGGNVSDIRNVGATAGKTGSFALDTGQQTNRAAGTMKTEIDEAVEAVRSEVNTHGEQYLTIVQHGANGVDTMNGEGLSVQQARAAATDYKTTIQGAVDSTNTSVDKFGTDMRAHADEVYDTIRIELNRVFTEFNTSLTQLDTSVNSWASGLEDIDSTSIRYA